MYRRHCLTVDVLTIFLPCLLLLGLGCWNCVIDVSVVVGLPIVMVLWFGPVVDFCNYLHVLKKEASLLRTESYLYLWVVR